MAVGDCRGGIVRACRGLCGGYETSSKGEIRLEFLPFPFSLQ